MRYSKFGAGDEYSWEVDHKIFVKNGGNNYLANLQALNHKRNIQKGDEVDWVFPE